MSCVINCLINDSDVSEFFVGLFLLEEIIIDLIYYVIFFLYFIGNLFCFIKGDFINVYFLKIINFCDVVVKLYRIYFF